MKVIVDALNQEKALCEILCGPSFQALVEAAGALGAVLDGSCTSTRHSVCQQALLHARHNPDVFSKVSNPSDTQYYESPMS